MSVYFTKVKEDEIEEIKAIYQYYVDNTTVTYHNKKLSHEEMKEILVLNHPLYESYAIRESEKGEILGYVILTQFKAREAFNQTAEVTIYLKKGYEGKGIGKQALKFIEERAQLKKLHTLIALICGENKASQSLFEKNGYKCCAHYNEVGNKFGRWLDLLAYQKML